MTIASRTVHRAYADLSRGQMHYRIAGSGPPLLMLHPNGFSSDLWSDVIPHLAREFTVVAPDRYAHGQSDPFAEDFPQYEEGLEASSEAGRIEPYLMETKVELLDHLGIAGADVLGQHTGSHLALELALTHPERTRRIVLVSLTDWLTEHEPTYTVPEVWAARGNPYADVDRLQVARETLAGLDAVGGPKSDGSHLVALWQRRLRQAGPLTTPAILDRINMMAMQCIHSWPMTSPQVMLYYHAGRRLPHLRVPALFLTAEHDVAGMWLEQQRALVPAHVETQLEVIAHAGAFMAMETPEAFARIVIAYLTRD
jgi:pimeloyl-ACP methyl ester carboxylesterase